MVEQACRKCGVSQPLTAFYRAPTGRPQAQCRRCTLSAQREPRVRARQEACRRLRVAAQRAAATEAPCRRCRQWLPKTVFTEFNGKRASWCNACREKDSAAEKTCARCAHTLPMDNFKPMRRKYRDSWCLECRRTYKREPHQRAKATVRRRIVLAQNPEARERKRAGHRADYLRHREQRLAKEAARPDKAQRWLDKRLRAKFSINLRDYEALCAAQGGCCAICGGTPSDRSRRLAIDHDHNTGAIRALLCHHCNTGLGNFRDEIERLEQAIAYLRRFQSTDTAA